MLKTIRIATLLAAVTLFGVPGSQAQVKMSPRGSVAQVIDGTTITVDYSRPRLRDRMDIFGTQIWWGHIWTPGADDATTIEFDKEITIENVAVPPGKYSMWMVHQKGDWEVILDPKWDQFHLPEPARPDDGYFFWVTPDTTAPVTETLTFDFAKLENFGADLEMRFANRKVVMEVKVPPTVDIVVSEEVAAPYVGTYVTEMLPGPWVPEGFSYDMEIVHHDGAFEALIKWSKDDEAMEQRLLLKTDQIFYFAFFDGEELMGTEGILFEFDLDENGRAKSFEVRTEKDDLWIKGTRKP
ncbi:DUF2911 domain-containing protein [bacterium]|nr:DUF2911 domain-containing protein [bacterium]